MKALNEEFNIINKNMDVFSKKIWEISQKEFSIVNFDNLVAEIRNYASEVFFVWVFGNAYKLNCHHTF